MVILQGPMAVRFCTKVNEPVADILDGIHDGWIALLKAAKPETARSIPTIEYLSTPVPARVLNGFAAVERSVSVKVESVEEKAAADGKGKEVAAAATSTVVNIQLPR